MLNDAHINWRMLSLSLSELLFGSNTILDFLESSTFRWAIRSIVCSTRGVIRGLQEPLTDKNPSKLKDQLNNWKFSVWSISIVRLRGKKINFVWNQNYVRILHCFLATTHIEVRNKTESWTLCESVLSVWCCVVLKNWNCMHDDWIGNANSLHGWSN